MDENDTLTIFWILFAQMGVVIDYIQDNKTVVYSVPSMSDFTSVEGDMIAGELLLQMAKDFFEEYGLHSEGRIRQEYWTEQMGQIYGDKIAKEIQE